MSEDAVKLLGAAVVSAVLIVAGFAVLFFGAGDPDLGKPAAGWVGAVIGYWLQ